MSFWVVPGVAPSCRALPLCCLEQLVLVGVATVTPDVCPQPTAGATVRLVCKPLPRGRTHCGVVWPLSGLLAHCQACGAALMRSGVFAGVGPQSAPRWVGQAKLPLLWVIPWGRGLAAPEGGRPIGGMDPQKHSIWCLCRASKFSEGNWFPLGFWLGDGWGRWHFPVPLFPTELSSVFWGSTTLPPGVLSPSPLRAELLTYNIPDVKSCWLSELTLSGPSAFASQTLGVLPCPGLPLHHPGSLPPVCVAHTISPPFVLSSMGLLSTLGSGESILLAFWGFSGIFRLMWVESKQSTGRGEPSVLLHRHRLTSSENILCILYRFQVV